MLNNDLTVGAENISKQLSHHLHKKRLWLKNFHKRQADLFLYERCSMTTKQNNFYSDDDQQFDDVKYVFFCDSLEEQYEQAKKNGLFDVLKVGSLWVSGSYATNN